MGSEIVSFAEGRGAGNANYGLMTLILVSVALAVALAVGWGRQVVQAVQVVQVGAEKQDLQHLHSQRGC